MSATALPEDGTPFFVEQEEAALALMTHLTSEQRSTAVVSNTPSEVDVSSENAGYVFLEPSGASLAASELDASQLDELMTLVDSFVGTLPADQAEQVRALVADELNAAILSWEGPTDAKPFGYGIRLPSLHILYSNEDDADHAHSLFRLLGHDYGAGLD